MRDEFYECSVAPEKERFQKTLYIIYQTLFVLTVIFFIGCAYFWLITFDTGFVFLIALSLITGVTLFFLKRRILLYYDYTYISGELRLIKVLNGKIRRKFLIIDCKSIQQIGKVGSDSFEKLYESKQHKLKIATPNGLSADKQLYYVLANVNNESMLVILECEEKMLTYLVSYRGKSIIEKDYK